MRVRSVKYLFTCVAILRVYSSHVESANNGNVVCAETGLGREPGPRRGAGSVKVAAGAQGAAEGGRAHGYGGKKNHDNDCRRRKPPEGGGWWKHAST
jgi:hypothetical protein